MKLKLLLFVLAVFLSASLETASAWSGAGHEAIAAEAFRELPPQLKAQSFEVLKAHPDFAKWQKAYHPNATIDLATYVFIRSSMWPDEIRGNSNRWDHPEWHFVDYPLRPPVFPFEPSPRPTNDVLYGIAQSEQILSDANGDPETRAVHMSYLIHLVGDLHQPLHCASLFTERYPTGDRGGNDFYVKPGQTGVRLHGIWDSLLGSSGSPRMEYNYGLEITRKYPRASLPEMKTHTTPVAWSLESRELAIEKGYLRGKLEGATNAAAAPALPADYTKAAKTVAERQAALAGYRLADEIQKSLKWSQTVPLLPENTNVAVQLTLPAKIGATEANKYYDETMTVTGKVVQISTRPTVTFLNLDQAGPGSPFTVVIFQSNLGEFGDLNKFKDREVEVNGTISEYHNRAEMVVESTNQIVIEGMN